LRALFEDSGAGGETPSPLPAAGLIGRLAGELPADVYRWTGHFPEHTRRLLAHLTERAHALGLVYPAERETAAVVSLTTFVTALAMNHVLRGSYLP
jgi:hypothetical protein